MTDLNRNVFHVIESMRRKPPHLCDVLSGVAPNNAREIQMYNECLDELEKRLRKDSIFVDEVVDNSWTLPKGTIITERYEVILPDGMTKRDLYSG